MPVILNLEDKILSLIRGERYKWFTTGVNLGGVAGVSGGTGGPLGGFIGQLTQARVTYDTSEAETMDVPASGSSLVNNLNRIRYRITTLESGGASGYTTIKDEGVEQGNVTILDFLGAGVEAVVSGSTALITVTVSGGVENLDELLDVTIVTPSGGDILYYHATSGWINQNAAEIGLSEVGHLHDDRYYTESEVDGLLHDSVTVEDTDSINLELTGQALSGYVLPGGVDHDQLLNFETTEHFIESSIDHTNIQNIGTTSHDDLDAHVASGIIHFLEEDISHLNIQDVGSNAHSVIDSHISDTAIHFDELGELSDVTIGGVAQGEVLTYESGDWVPSGIIAGHDPVTIADTSSLNLELTDQSLSGYVLPGGVDHDQLLNFETNEHFTEASIDHTNIQNIGTNSHDDIDTHVASGSIHFTEGSISHLNIQDIGSNAHSAIDTHISNEPATSISTHANDDDAHHAKYTDAEVETVITAELVDGQSIDSAIDTLISTHAGLSDPHTGYVLETLADDANDFLVATGADTFIKKTLAETGAILEGDMQHDNLQGYEADEHVANAIPYGGLVYNTETWLTPTHSLQLMEIWNLLFRADARYTVTLGNWATENVGALFDGNFDQSANNIVASGEIATVTIDFIDKGEYGANGLVYPQGYVYVHCYKSSPPYSLPAGVTGRFQDRDDAWHALTTPTEIGTNTWRLTIPSNHYMVLLELSIEGHADDGSRIAEIDLFERRQGANYWTVPNKYKAEKLYSDWAWYDSNNDAQVTIGTNGNITLTGNVDGVDVSTLPALISANTTQAEVEAIIDDELVDGQSIDLAIDSLIGTHTTDDDAHHTKYTDSEALAQAQTRIEDTAYPTGWDADTLHAPSQNALFDKIDAMDTIIAGISGGAGDFVEDDIYGSGWDGDTTHAPSQNAVYDKIDGMDTLIAANTTVTEVEAVITAEIVDGQSIDLAIDSLIATHTTDDDAHHAKYTDTEVESVITAEIVDGQSIDNAIDSLISTHVTDDDAHHTPYTDTDAEAVVTAELVDGQSIDLAIDSLISTHTTDDDAHHTRYADSETEDVITAELVDGQSIDLAIDSLITTHATDDDAHHVKYTDAEALTQAQTRILDGAYPTSWDTDTTHAPSRNALYDIISTISGGGGLWSEGAGGDIYYNGGEVGIGTSSPDEKLHIIGDGVTSGIPLLLQNEGATTITQIESYHTSAYGGGGIIGYGARNTVASPSNVVSDDRLGFFVGGGYAGTSFKNVAEIGFYADSGTISETSLPSYILLKTTADGSVSRTERVRIGSTEVVINDPGNDVDFRIESDDNTSILFVDGGNDDIIIGDNVHPTGGQISSDENKWISTDDGYNFLSLSSLNNSLPLNSITTYAARGTVASPSATQLNDYFLFLGARGYDDADWDTTSAGMIIQASENWDATGHGSKITFEVTLSGTTTRVPVLRLGDDTGNLSFVVINEQGLDMDFRVEGEDDPYLLMTDAFNDRVIIGSGITNHRFEVSQNDKPVLEVDNSIGARTYRYVTGGNSPQASFTVTTDKSSGTISDGFGAKQAFRVADDNGDHHWQGGLAYAQDFTNDRSELQLMMKSGAADTYATTQVFNATYDEIVINEPGDDRNFRVESLNQTDALHVDAGTGYVTIHSAKTTTGDPTGNEGLIYWNTVDNVIKMYVDGAWRTLATW